MFWCNQAAGHFGIEAHGSFTIDIILIERGQGPA